MVIFNNEPALTDLISREMALEALEEAKLNIKGFRLGKTILSEYSKQVREGYINIVRNIPATEAEPTRYGEWMVVGKTKKGSTIHKCSYCKKQKAGRPRSMYCPDCGAKMITTTVTSSEFHAHDEKEN